MRVSFLLFHICPHFRHVSCAYVSKSIFQGMRNFSILAIKFEFCQGPIVMNLVREISCFRQACCFHTLRFITEILGASQLMAVNVIALCNAEFVDCIEQKLFILPPFTKILIEICIALAKP